MKKSVILLCLGALLVTLPAFAAKKKPLVESVSGQGYGMAGCGLGSIVFGEQSGMVQIFAGTTNGLYGNQTFGITSGTSNCAESGGNTASNFIMANRDALKKDISRGNGETVANLSQMMGCKDAALLGSKLQQNFGHIFPAQNASDDSIVESIMSTVKSDAQLAQSCNVVS